MSPPFLTGTPSPGCPLASVPVAVASVAHPDSRSPSCPERWLRRVSQAGCALEGRQRVGSRGEAAHLGEIDRDASLWKSLLSLYSCPSLSHSIPGDSVRKGKSADTGAVGRHPSGWAARPGLGAACRGQRSPMEILGGKSYCRGSLCSSIHAGHPVLPSTQVG